MLLQDDRPYGTGIDAWFADSAVNQELPVALGAGDRRSNKSDDTYPGGGQRSGGLVNRQCVYVRIANDAASAHHLLPSFELRLDQKDPIRALRSERSDLRRDER